MKVYAGNVELNPVNFSLMIKFENEKEIKFFINKLQSRLNEITSASNEENKKELGNYLIGVARKDTAEKLLNSATPKLQNSDVGSKSDTQNIISNTLDNHKFGFNLPQVQNIRNLIQSIDIYQVHAGRFNQVTLVNPRISAFTHDTLNYAAGDKTLELTFTVEYEYAYYTIQNLQLTDPDTGAGGETNNNSSILPFTHGEFLELPALAFNAQLNDFIESNNPLLQSDNPILQRIGKNVQSTIGATTGAFLSNTVRRVSASALDGLANISPQPYSAPSAVAVTARSFASTANPSSGKYPDMNRTGGNGG